MVLLANDLGRLAVNVPFSFSLTTGLGFNTSYSRLLQSLACLFSEGLYMVRWVCFSTVFAFADNDFMGKLGTNFWRYLDGKRTKDKLAKAIF